jgi:AraC-like DNA-binding protein
MSALLGNSASRATAFHWGTASAAELLKARSWPKVSIYNFRRPAREMHWKGTWHRVSLQLAPVPHALVQVENSRARELTLSGISITPAGLPLRTMMGAGEVIGILQAPETYRDLASELTISGTSLEPVWSTDNAVLENLVRFLFKEIDSHFVDNLMVDALNRAIAIEAMHAVAGSHAQLPVARKLSHERIRRVEDYINAHLDGPLRLTEIAAEACLSPFHFSRCFKHSFGVGLHRFVIRRRLEQARELLAGRRHSLAEIAVAVGFDSQASFTARFTRDVGISPGRFRKETQGPCSIE